MTGPRHSSGAPATSITMPTPVTGPAAAGIADGGGAATLDV